MNDIEQQFKEYLTGKLKELQGKGKQEFNSLTVTVEDFIPGKLSFYFKAWTNKGGHSGECGTAQEAVDGSVSKLARSAAQLRKDAAAMLKEAAELEALS